MPSAAELLELSVSPCNGMGSGPNGEFLRPDACSNNKKTWCHNKANKYCKDCHLVQYCSAKCQKADWPAHKIACKMPRGLPEWQPTYDREGRPYKPVTGDGDIDGNIHCLTFWWGNTPPYDILNLGANEGLDYSKDLELMFAASGDLRCIMQTVNQTPSTYKQKLDIVVNDSNADIVLRNTIILLLAFVFPGGEASELIVHLWYSAALPSTMYKRGITEQLVPLVQDACTEMQGAGQEDFFSQIWYFGHSTLRISLVMSQWRRLLEILKLKHTQPIADANQKRMASMLDGMTPAQDDALEAAWLLLPPRHRLCDHVWRKNGLLLPFARANDPSISEFSVPNPTLFSSSGDWLVHWSIRLLPYKGSAIFVDGYKGPRVPSNDINGMMFFERRKLVQGFCKAIQTLKVNFSMYQDDARHMGMYLTKMDWHRPNIRFDRIDTSNLADDGYLFLTPTLASFGPLLKNKRENPHATLLTSFLMAKQDVRLHEAKFGYPPEHSPDFEDKVYDDLLSPEQVNWAGRGNIWYGMLAHMLIDKEEVFRRYKDIYRFTESAHSTGVEEKTHNTIIGKCPYQMDRTLDLETQRKQVASRGAYNDGSAFFAEWSSHDRKEEPLPAKQNAQWLFPGESGVLSGMPGDPSGLGGITMFSTVLDGNSGVGKTVFDNMEKLIADLKLKSQGS